MDTLAQRRLVPLILLLSLGAVLIELLGRISGFTLHVRISREDPPSVHFSSLMKGFREPPLPVKTVVHRRSVPVPRRFIRTKVRPLRKQTYTIILKGIVWDPNAPLAVIAIGNLQSELYVRPGQQIGDISVISIARDHVTLRVSGRIMRKYLSNK